MPHAGGTEVAFFVDFEFRSRILQAAIGVVFNEAVRRMVNAFRRRAQQIYGPPPAAGAPVQHPAAPVEG
jgi:coenzyme Q-binding protein COQ10